MFNMSYNKSSFTASEKYNIKRLQAAYKIYILIKVMSFVFKTTIQYVLVVKFWNKFYKWSPKKRFK